MEITLQLNRVSMLYEMTRSKDGTGALSLDPTAFFTPRFFFRFAAFRLEFVGVVIGMSLLYSDPLSIKFSPSTAKLLAVSREVPTW